MNRRFLLMLCALVPVLLTGCASTGGGAIDDSKIGRLAGSVGVTSEQAQAGVGAMLSLAQQRLDTGEFQKIAGVIPRANEYVALGTRLGAYQDAITSATGLSAAFGKIGISPEQANKFVPTVTDYVSKAAGRDVGLVFANAMK